MRALIAAGIYPPDIGGPATYAAGYAEYLVKTGDAVNVLTFSNTHGSQTEKGITVVSVQRGNPFFHHARYLLTLMRLARSADTLYAQGPVAGGLQAVVVAKLWRKKYAVKVTGDYAWEQFVHQYHGREGIDDFQTATRMPFHIRLLRMIQRAVVRHAAVVIVPSVYLSKMVQQWGAKNISVVPNAFVSGSKTLYQPPEGPPFEVVSVGRLVPWKGFSGLIEAVGLLNSIMGKVRLTIIGDGAEQSALMAHAKRMRIADSVSFLGRRTSSEVIDAFSRSHLFVLNSSYEGLSHTILEAQSVGIPVAVSNVGGNPEVVVHGETGMLFPYNDVAAMRAVIERMLMHREEALAMANRARQSLSRYEPGSVYGQTRAVVLQYCYDNPK